MSLPNCPSIFSCSLSECTLLSVHVSHSFDQIPLILLDRRHHGYSCPITMLVFTLKTLLIFMPTKNWPRVSLSLTVSDATKMLFCRFSYPGPPPKNVGTHTGALSVGKYQLEASVSCT